MRYCRLLRIGLNLLISLSLEATSLSPDVLSVDGERLQLSLQRGTVSGQVVVPGKEVVSHGMDGTDIPEKTESVLHRGEFVSSDKTEA
jgi:hypothetical protein